MQSIFIASTSVMEITTSREFLWTYEIQNKLFLRELKKCLISHLIFYHYRPSLLVSIFWTQLNVQALLIVILYNIPN